MNTKRIKELAIQAQLTGGVRAVPDFIVEKFTKLIVKECIEQIRGEYLPVMESKEIENEY